MDGLIVQTVGDEMCCLPYCSRLGLHVMMVVCEAVLILLSDMGSRSISLTISHFLHKQACGTALANARGAILLLAGENNNIHCATSHALPFLAVSRALACLVSTARATPSRQSASARILFAFVFLFPEGAPRAVSLRGRCGTAAVVCHRCSFCGVEQAARCPR